MRVLLLAPVDSDKFAGIGSPPSPYHECPIPYPQPQAFWWNAMRSLGHEVHVFPYVADQWPGLPLPLSVARMATQHSRRLRRWAVPAAMYLSTAAPVRAFNESLLETVRRTAAQVMLISGGITALHAQTVAHIRASGVKLVALRGIPFATHPAKNEMEMAEYLHLAVVNDPHHELDWQLCGCPRTICLPISGCEPEFHRPLPSDDTAVRKHAADVCFIGSLEPRVYYGGDRVAFLEAIADLGLAIYSGTPEAFRNSRALMACWRGQARQTDIPAITSAAKVHVNVLARAMPGGGNYRTFEIAGCGGLQLCDRFQDSWFVDGREIVRFRTPSDLRAIVIRFLHNDAERTAIAEAGRARALREHTFRHRFLALFDILQAIS